MINVHCTIPPSYKQLLFLRLFTQHVRLALDSTGRIYPVVFASEDEAHQDTYVELTQDDLNILEFLPDFDNRYRFLLTLALSR